MTILNWLSPGVLRPLGWALLHFLWQGTALAAVAACAMSLVRRAGIRYVLAVVFLTLMLLAPVATYLLYSSPGPTPAWNSGPTLATVLSSSSGPSAANFSPVYPGHRHTRPAPGVVPWMTWAVLAWMAGVACFALRTAGGFLVLERLRRRQSLALEEPLQALCLNVQQRLGLRRAISYCQCLRLQAPVVMGWFSPVLLLPVSALTGLSAEQLQAVIAHELAHVKRLDTFVNAYQVLIETLLFYHPAVWWLSRRIRQEREHCCDDAAVALCGDPVEYARALTLLEEWRGAPALAMAATRGPLASRIMRLLGLNQLGAGMRSAGVAASVVCLVTALAAGSVLLGIAHASPTQVGATSASTAPASQAQPAAPTTEAAPSAPAPQSEAASPMPSDAPSPAAEPSPAELPAASGKPVAAESYIDAMKSAGLKNLTVDELVALKEQGVTPEYVRAMREQGIHPDADNLVAMKIQGITPEYVHELRASGLTISDDDIIAMKIQGIDTAYLRGLQQAGIHPDTDELIGMKVQGVTPELVRALMAAGLKLEADELIALKIQGVTPEYIREMHEQGIDADADELVGMKIQGVTPDYIREVHALGLKPDGDELVGM
ncbi:MAG: M56 family metallopeptidase, partial [Terriglobales bacterium]